MGSVCLARALFCASALFLGIGCSSDTAVEERERPSPQPPQIPSGPIGLPAELPSSSSSSQPLDPGSSVDARVLILAADGSEPDLPAIRQTLDLLGTPYDVWIATSLGGASLKPRLTRGEQQGSYQAVLLTTGNLSYSADGGATWTSGLSPAQWQELWDYEAKFGVRQATWYTFPTADYGFQGTAKGSSASLHLRFSAPGAEVFSYVNTASGVDLSRVYMYLAQAATPGDGGSVTPLLTDPAGHALAVVRRWPDGRENLACTFDSNPYLVHSLQLSYGIVNWATRGLFIGERRTYLSAQVDDLFLDADEWPAPVTPGTNYRMTGDDLRFVAAWQQQAQAAPLFSGFRLDLAFNGWGTTPGLYRDDTLTPAAVSLQERFKWISHTWDHVKLDDASYADTVSEITRNNDAAARLKLASYSPTTLVTPEVSGLFNAAAMQAAADQGVRFLVSDTSRPEHGTPGPNEGTYNPRAPSILQIPRRPTNLYYNVTTPEQWVDEYNSFYGPGGRWPTWDHALSYTELLDKESEVLLQYLLRGELYPWMFHQTNLRRFTLAGTARSLLTDLIDATVRKYSALLTLPIVSPTMDALGAQLEERMRYRAAALRATIVGGRSLVLSAPSSIVVPVTGLRTVDAELYGKQYIARVRIPAGQTVTIPLP